MDLWAIKSSAETRGKHALKPMSGAVFVLVTILLHCPVSSSKVSCSISFRRNAAFLPKGDCVWAKSTKMWTRQYHRNGWAPFWGVAGKQHIVFDQLLGISWRFRFCLDLPVLLQHLCNTEPPSTISCNPPHHHHHQFPKCVVCYKSFVPRSDECCFPLPTIGLPTEVVLSSLDGAGKC